MSREQALNQILNNFDPSCLPIGVYVVTPDGQFLICNAAARRLLGLPADGDITKKISDFYADPAERENVLKRVAEAEAKGSYLENEVIHFKVDGHTAYMQNNCRSLRNPETKEIVGYMGSLVDITAEHKYSTINKALNERITELTTDIGRILHANTTTLIMVQQTLDIAIDALGANPFGDTRLPSSEKIDDVIGRLAKALAAALEKILDLLKQESRKEALPADLWEELQEQTPVLSDFVGSIPTPESRASTLRIIAHRVKEIAMQIQPGRLPKQLTRELLNCASRLEQTTALVAALTTRTAVIQMDYTIRSLREFITVDVRMKEKRQKLQVTRLIETVSNQLMDFAYNSHVRIRMKNEAGSAVIVGAERELIRALANLLHNSVKYSWRRDRSRKPWVDIRIYQERPYVCIVFENWGVPIARDELKDDTIFQLGYRGKWSKDRGRLGTGIGLTDAMEVAKKHGGYLKIDSRPARSHTSLSPESEQYFNQPFLTTVKMFLPEAVEEK